MTADPLSLQGRRALVTGGAIGSAVVRALTGAAPVSGAGRLEADLRQAGAIAALVHSAGLCVDGGQRIG